MKSKSKYIFLVIGLTCFVYLVLSFGLKNIIINLHNTGWYFIPIVLTWVLVYLCNTVAWKFIINKPDLSFFQLLSITISGYSLNYLTPFFNLGGEPYRAIALKEKLGINKSVSVTLSYLMLHFLSSFLIWITAVIVMLLYMPLSKAAFYILIVSLVAFLLVVYLFVKAYKHGVTKFFAKFIIKLPLLKKIGEQVNGKEKIILEIDENIKELYLTRKKSFLAANAFEYLSRLIATVEYYFILRAIGYSPTLLDTFIINAGVGLIANLFFVIPFELGIKEGGMYAMLGLLHYSPQVGIYVSLVTRLRELFWIFIGLVLIQLNKPTDKTKLYSTEEIV